MTDKLIQSQLEDTLSYSVGAKVEFDNFHFSLFGLNVAWSKLQITDPNFTMENILETGNAKFDIDGYPLLFGRVIINDLKLENVRSGTKRLTDGKMIFPNSDKTEGILNAIGTKLKTEFEESSSLATPINVSSFNIEDYLNSSELTTIDKLSNLENNIKNFSDSRKADLEKFNTIINNSEKLQNDLKTINISQIKGVSSYLSTANKLIAVKKELKSSVDFIKNQKQTLTAEVNNIIHTYSSINSWIDEDIIKINQKIKLPSLDKQNITELVFGKQIVDNFLTGLGYLKTINEFSDKYSNNSKINEPARLKGQNISFPITNGYPSLWIKNITLSTGDMKSENNEIFLEGSASNITTDQDITNSPTVVRLSGVKNNVKFSLNGNFDRRNKSVSTIYELIIQDVDINSTQIGKMKIGSGNIDKGNLSLNSKVSFSNNTFENISTIEINNLAYNSTNPSETGYINPLLDNIFNSLSELKIDLVIKNDKNGFDVTINSDLDNKIGDAFKNRMTSEIKKVKDQIRSSLTNKYKNQIADIRSLYQNNILNLNSKLSEHDNLITSNTKLIEQKKSQLLSKISSEKNPLVKLGLKKIVDLLKW